MYQVASARSTRAEVAELADATDLKSVGPHGPCGFDSRPRHQEFVRDSSADRLLDTLLNTFLLSRREGTSQNTLGFYEGYLRRARRVVRLNIASQLITGKSDGVDAS